MRIIGTAKRRVPLIVERTIWDLEGADKLIFAYVSAHSLTSFHTWFYSFRGASLSSILRKDNRKKN